MKTCWKCKGTGKIYSKTGRPVQDVNMDIIKLRKQGKTLVQISKKLGLSVGAVHRNIIKYKEFMEK